MFFQEAVDRRDGEAGVRAEQNAASRIAFCSLLISRFRIETAAFEACALPGRSTAARGNPSRPSKINRG